MNILSMNVDAALLKELTLDADRFQIKFVPFSPGMKLQSIAPKYVMIDFSKNFEEGDLIYHKLQDQKVPLPCIALADLEEIRKLKGYSNIAYVLGVPLKLDHVETLFQFLLKPPKALNPKMKELFLQYDRSIPDKMHLLETLSKVLNKNPNKESLTALRTAVHKVAGNSGTYGYGKTSNLALKLQDKLDAYLAKNEFQNLDFENDIKDISFYFQFRDDEADAISSSEILDLLKGGPVTPTIKESVHVLSKEGIATTTAAAGTKTVTLTNKDIVIVDDDPSVLSYVKQVFSIFGYNVIAINGGKAGLQFLMQCKDLQSCCMVILDLEMPEVDGLTILKKIKEKFGTMRVVFLSSKFNPENLEEVKKFGAFDFIQKPFNSNVMKEILKHKF